MLIKMKCPQCGASMEMDDSRDHVFCSYCGTKIANMAEKVEITQNVNYSGTVRHVMDRSNEPNLYISYATAVPTVVMVVRIVDTGTKNTYLNGQTQTYHLRKGQHTIVLKIGKKNYNRTIIIPEDNTPVRINAAYTGRRAEITIDQPIVTATDPVTGQQTQQIVKTNSKKQSALAVISFILSFLAFAAFLAVPLAILDLFLSKKDKDHKHGLSIAALIIGTIVALICIVSCAGGKKTSSVHTYVPQAVLTTESTETHTTKPEKTEAATEALLETATPKSEETEAPETEEPEETPEPTEKATPEPTEEPAPLEYLNALIKAQAYVEMMHMSKARLFEQLTSEYGEGFSDEAAQYAVEHVKADWKENALKMAESYSDNLHMSKARIYDQLTSEYGEMFTAEEAQYAIDTIQADWNANALATARNYRDNLNMSPSAIKNQLTSSYGEKFTAEEAQYAIDHLDD